MICPVHRSSPRKQPEGEGKIEGKRASRRLTGLDKSRQNIPTTALHNPMSTLVKSNEKGTGRGSNPLTPTNNKLSRELV